MLPSLYGGTSHHPGLYADAEWAGYHLPSVSRSNGTLGAGFPACERHSPSAVARNEHRYAAASAHGEAWHRGS